jgi:hypothetical protein
MIEENTAAENESLYGMVERFGDIPATPIAKHNDSCEIGAGSFNSGSPGLETTLPLGTFTSDAMDVRAGSSPNNLSHDVRVERGVKAAMTQGIADGQILPGDAEKAAEDNRRRVQEEEEYTTKVKAKG